MRAHLLLLVACVAAVSAIASAKLCPAVTPARKHFNLKVTEGTITLPDGKKLKQLMYNASVVGPPIVLTLGEEVSIDVQNSLPPGVGAYQRRFKRVMCMLMPSDEHVHDFDLMSAFLWCLQLGAPLQNVAACCPMPMQVPSQRLAHSSRDGGYEGMSVVPALPYCLLHMSMAEVLTFSQSEV